MIQSIFRYLFGFQVCLLLIFVPKLFFVPSLFLFVPSCFVPSLFNLCLFYLFQVCLLKIVFVSKFFFVLNLLFCLFVLFYPKFVYSVCSSLFVPSFSL